MAEFSPYFGADVDKLLRSAGFRPRCAICGLAIAKSDLERPGPGGVGVSRQAVMFGDGDVDFDVVFTHNRCASDAIRRHPE